MSNVVKPTHLEPGALWTFVHRDGSTVEYVYDRQMVGKVADPTGKTPGLDAIHAPLNPVTGKPAQVSEKWLREGPVNGGFPHWLTKAEAPELADAA